MYIYEGEEEEGEGLEKGEEGEGGWAGGALVEKGLGGLREGALGRGLGGGERGATPL